MKAGRYPQAGVSQLTIRIYRISLDGETDAHVRQLTATSEHDVDGLPESHEWPPCRCPRCRDGHELAPR